MIPNISNGSVIGKMVRKYAPEIYDKHVPLDIEDMVMAHERVGLKTIYCNYFLAYNYGVLNFGGKYDGLRKYYIRKGTLQLLLTKNKIVGTKKHAPYIVYVGQKEIP